MQIRLLGPVELCAADGTSVPLGGAKERALLAALALSAGEAVPPSRLIDALWGDEPPRTASATLRSYLSRLRKTLAQGGIELVSSPAGITLKAQAGAIDVAAVEADAAAVRSARRPADAAELLARCLGRWRGASLGDVAELPFAVADAARLDEFRLNLLEQRVDADLACGRHGELTGELEAACEANPYRESLWAAWMLALYRCGRQADALRVYGQLRARLVEDLGIEPSPTVRDLESAILSQSRSLDWVGESAPASSAEQATLLSDQGELVGRGAELVTLRRAWEAAVAGHTRLVLIGGEPGIGKTRLATEAARLAAVSGGRARYGRCDDQAGGPFGAVSQALAGLAGAESLQRGTRELAERDGVLDDVVAVLADAAAETPLLVVLDDLQWASVETVLLLRHLLRVGGNHRLLVVGTYRDTEVGDEHPLARALADLRGDPAVEVMRLRGLGPREVARLVVDELGDDPDIAGRVHADSGGNPFVARELARHLAQPGASGSLPRSVRELVLRRARALGDEVHGVLRIASVIGKVFPLRLVETVAGGDDDAVLSALEAGCDARLVEDAGGGRFGFVHDLVRSAFLDELSSARRARLHRQVADAIEAMPAGERDVHALAHHRLEAVADGAPVETAVDAAIRSAELATTQGAPERALATLERAETVLGAVGGRHPGLRCDLLLTRADVLEYVGDRAGLRALALEAADEARVDGSPQRLARCAKRHYGWGAVGVPDPVTVALSEEALEALGDSDDGWRSRVLAVLAQVLGHSHANPDVAVPMAEESLRLARRTADVDALLFALQALDRTRLGHPEVAQRLPINDELVRVAAQAGRDDMRFVGIRQQAAVRLELGDIAGFEAERRALDRLQERVGSWMASFWVRAYRITSDVVQGRFAEAEAALDELGRDLADETNAVTMWAGMQAMLRREQGRPLEVVPLLEGARAAYPTLAIFPVGVASFLAEGGELSQAQPLYEELVRDDLAAVPRDQTFGACLGGLAEVTARLRDADRAPVLRRLLEPYRGLLVVTGAATFCGATVDRLVGMLLALEGSLDESVAAYEAAIRTEEAMGAAPFVARTRRWLGEALLARGADGDGERAAAELATSLDEARRLGIGTLENEVLPLLAWATGSAASLDS